ncbi:hypothetical protein CKM354_000141800 [Cercospora kikuchii]|uniref:Uncharacterized protein n=1 Tax=Cercospora kikuchii TaxID=84275 RepID=A0A9P3C879_9PEZI|nr:uncharacterized protein CKM354_000141800 [Cercospora kikuchii]GIZ37991.1 hypothetical protein CKM354_000141800 [Cercospora kikuchii]
MPKRRRERDKPKCGPEATYDPNKRVLLSYGSDDEDVEAATPPVDAAPETALDESALANYQFAEYPDDEEEPEATLGAEAESDTAPGLEDKQSAVPPPREPREVGHTDGRDGDEDHRRGAAPMPHVSTSKRQRGAGKSDTGQRVALGAAANDDDDDYNEEDYDSTTEEALAYLESVRAERQGLPEVLAASRQVWDNHGDEEGEDDADNGYLADDGTYIARPEPTAVAADDNTDPQQVFSKALKDRFMLQRKHLHMNTTSTKLAELGDGYPTSFPEGNKGLRAEWHRILGSKSPMPAQLRAMNEETIFNLLKLLQSSYLLKGKNIKTVTSAWIWSLLCRLDDVGNMTNDQVYPLRELGKRVIFLQLHFFDPEAAAHLEAIEQREQTPAATVDDQLEDAAETEAGEGSNSVTTNNQQVRTHHGKPTENTLATLDTILVIVGEVFGQRDLLEFRQPWAKSSKEAAA